jgi:hypothetical protein
MYGLMLAWALLSQPELTEPKSPPDAELVALEEGYMRLVTDSYSLDVPLGWDVSTETPWGARKMTPGNGGELGVMTANAGSTPNWDRLYETSLYFIQREKQGRPTPPVIEKDEETGYETATFQILDEEGFAERRYVMILHPDGRLLALSVKIQEAENEESWTKHFKRMVSSAEFLE